MRRILVSGGVKLQGEVSISGSKNAALPILAATILTNGESKITNVPDLLDIQTMIRVLRSLGLRAEFSTPNTVRTWVNGNIKHVAPYELVTKMRASFFIIGPILAKSGLARIPLPGGCAIGARPVAIHLKGLEALGATVGMERGFVIVKANKLKGNRIYQDFPSVGATETLMMAATLADGETLIENCAREPEIVDLANFLRSCGAKIEGDGTETIKIQGVASLGKADNYRVIPDRIEAGTFIIAAAATHGEVLVKNLDPHHIEAVLFKLKEAGINFEVGKDWVRVLPFDKIKPIDVKTLPYPGFPTDLQPQMSALLALSTGTSVVTETVFENRFMHVHELRRLGADVRLEGQSAIITGVDKLQGAPVKSRDLRAGAAMVIAGLVAEGETLVEDLDRFIVRGYEGLDKKLWALGAKVRELKNISEYDNDEDLD